MFPRNSSPARRVFLALALAGLTVALVAGFIGCGRPPQMGASAEVFRAVDALFTAVTARDETLLSQCEQRLHAFRDAGELLPEASTYLDKIIREARAGNWETAAETLYDFMKVQRRDDVRKQERTHKLPREDRG